jgi:hypothetical protein
MSSQVFGGSILAGLGIAFLLAQLRPVFFDRRQLSEVTGVPVLGSINLLTVPRARMRQRFSTVAFALALLLLIASYAAVLAVFLLGLDVSSNSSM